MDSQLAYETLRAWAQDGGHQLPETLDPAERATSVSEFIAILRLRDVPLLEPDFRALRQVMLDYLAHVPSADPGGESEDIRIGHCLERLIGRAAEHAVAINENLPYQGCGPRSPSLPSPIQPLPMA